MFCCCNVKKFKYVCVHFDRLYLNFVTFELVFLFAFFRTKESTFMHFYVDLSFLIQCNLVLKVTCQHCIHFTIIEVCDYGHELGRQHFIIDLLIFICGRDSDTRTNAL